MKESLNFILSEQKELSVIGGISALLGWDQMTYMPPNGALAKSEQSSFISRIAHEKVVSDKFWNHINILYKKNNFDKLSDANKAIVSRLYRDVEKARKIPSDFVEKLSKTTTLAYPAWQKAREKSDFSKFSNHLKNIIELEKEYCGYIGLPGPRYNSLLDGYEEGMTVEKLRKEFMYLKKNVIKILDRITDCEVYKKQKDLDLYLPVESQKKLCNLITEKMFLTKRNSRLDVSTHPFTTSIGYDDVRFTTSFERENPLFSFFSTVHEAGHALYELGMPQDIFKFTVISDSPSLGLHESQSRFWENMIARNIHFWNYFYPIFKKMSPDFFKKVDLDFWYKEINKVKPSFIRVEADELTYSLHIILRFELENLMIEDEIKVSELPSLWNEKMKEMLGIAPKTDRDGVLQDMHWSGGSIGYFPTYSIGTIYASQLFDKLTCIYPSIASDIRKADFTKIHSWLKENIYNYGRRISAEDIIKKCCGEGLNSKVFINYLKNKYYIIYDI